MTSEQESAFGSFEPEEREATQDEKEEEEEQKTKQPLVAMSPFERSFRSAVEEQGDLSVFKVEEEDDESQPALKIRKVSNDKKSIKKAVPVPRTLGHSKKKTAAKPSLDLSSKVGLKMASDELKLLRAPLKENGEEWKSRIKAMDRIEELINDGIMDTPIWAVELEKLKPMFVIQMKDLRSAIIKRVCDLVIMLASIMKDGFGDVFAACITALFHNLYVTIKAISQSCHECIIACLKHTNNIKLLQPFLGGLTDDHAVVREKSACYLQILLEKAIEKGEDVSTLPTPLLARLTDAISVNIVHGDTSVRLETRKLYKTMNDIFPQEGARLFASFPPQTQKQFLRDQETTKKASTKKK